VIKPLDDRIVVEKIKTPDQTPAGLYVVAEGDFGPQEGKVVAKSDRCTLDVEVGGVVIYSRYDGVEVEHEGKQLLILGSKGVLAVRGE
jgi:co-chaperonin GroES (HSP10)